ncbi:calcium-binding protein [Leptolyngbya sp. CCNP1308]|uniref:calcium-binding protein n=1 Tax=Leptolyngbya sp. CCNP1308 TaxID=3110255 RepID=UPI002B1E9DEA|nr:calcium-binding protein [Leptolyngbya sp. CCNP1308]MEA5451767.1 calcium-binding protein [Leptolyngbya sp. CCNP1308]
MEEMEPIDFLAGTGLIFLNGRAGADFMQGGQEADTYIVDNIGDHIVEVANQGTDTVYASISYTLSANVENLTLFGTANLNGVGSIFSNIIIGNSGSNTLIGGTGGDRLDGGVSADVMQGGPDSDTYVVDNIDDRVLEFFGEGIDIIHSSVSYRLSADVENLTLLGATNLGGTGNDLDNVIKGNRGDNLLLGGGGNDRLIGGAGNDTLLGNAEADRYIFDSGRAFSNGDLGVDTIIFFERGSDKIELSKATFTTLASRGSLVGTAGFSDISEFALVTSDAAAALSRADIVYNAGNGKLFYNPNGSLAGFDSSSVQGGHFATLSGAPSLSSNDFCLTEPIQIT